MGLLDFWKSLFGGSEQPEEKTSEPVEEQESVPPEAQTYPQEPKERRYFTVGFDWGTSCSKVVIRDPYGRESLAYLVNFGDLAANVSPYFLPSSFSVGQDDQIRLAKEGGSDTISALKVHLMQHPEEAISKASGARPEELAALYVAKTLRYSRRWFWQEYGDRYEQYRPVWGFNLGIPAASHDDEEVNALFDRIARVGWGLSQRKNPTISEARGSFRKLKRGTFDAGIHEDLVGVIPEVAAQVVGYARSSLRRTGLHILVDVGASTLDLAGFILTEDEGQDRYSILEAGVYPLGAFQLERQRLPEVKELGRTLLDSEVYEDWADGMAKRCHNPMRKVPSGVRRYFPETYRKDIRWSEIKHIDQDLENDCYRTTRTLVADLRKNRAPKGPMWQKGLPIFMAGGGKDVEVYRDALQKVNHWRDDFLRVAPFEVRPLPSLQNLEAPEVSSDMEHRFSVAYGLSYPADDIGEIRPPHEIPDLDLTTDTKEGYLDTTDWRDTKAWT